jgi:hypothetical protein
MPWANDGGTAWNAVRCSPIDADPGAPGEPCTVEDSPVSGLDSCELGAMCWDVDLATNVGTCVGFCTGSEAAPECPPSDRCVIANEGVLILCLPACDPVLGDCDEGQVCRPEAADGSFVCIPATGARAGYGDPCTNLYDCGEGLACASSMQMQGIGQCTLDVAGCCTAFCDTFAADPGCPDQALGQVCVPFYGPDDAPPGHEDLGTCVIE